MNFYPEFTTSSGRDWYRLRDPRLDSMTGSSESGTPACCVWALMPKRQEIGVMIAVGIDGETGSFFVMMLPGSVSPGTSKLVAMVGGAIADMFLHLGAPEWSEDSIFDLADLAPADVARIIDTVPSARNYRTEFRAHGLTARQIEIFWRAAETEDTRPINEWMRANGLSLADMFGVGNPLCSARLPTSGSL